MPHETGNIIHTDYVRARRRILGNESSVVRFYIEGNTTKNPAVLLFGGAGDFDKSPYINGLNSLAVIDPDRYMERMARSGGINPDLDPIAYALFNTPRQDHEFDPQNPTNILNLPVMQSLSTTLERFHKEFPDKKIRIMGNSYGAALLLTEYLASVVTVINNRSDETQFMTANRFLTALSHVAKDMILFSPAIGFQDYKTPSAIASKKASSHTSLLRKPAKLLVEHGVKQMHSGHALHLTREQVLEQTLEKSEELTMMGKAWDSLMMQLPPEIGLKQFGKFPNILVVASKKDHQVPSSALYPRIDPLAQTHKLIRILKLDTKFWTKDMHSPFMDDRITQPLNMEIERALINGE